jgi:16S rRNA processing protein RimM
LKKTTKPERLADHSGSPGGQLSEAELNEPADDWVWLAGIRRPQGRKGEVFAEILTDYPQKFAERKRLWLLPGNSSGAGATNPSRPGAASPIRDVELSAFWLHKGGVVLHFSGIDSISAAETLSGLIVAIPRDQRAPLDEDEVHIADLIGCTVFDVRGAEAVQVGEIQNVDRTAGPVPLLIVSGRSGEVLIPFAKSYLRQLDVPNRRIEMNLPEGLIDLNS